MKLGERQVAPELSGIRIDHIARYMLACKYVEEGQRVCDYGSGICYGSNLLAYNGAIVTAYDIDPEAIEYGKEHYSHPNLSIVSELPLNPYLYFDMCVAFELIEHVEDGEASLKAIADMVRYNGLVILSTPDQETQPWSAKRFPFHTRHYTQIQFIELIRSCGLTLVEKFTQRNKMSPVIDVGWGGLFNIAVCKKS